MKGDTAHRGQREEQGSYRRLTHFFLLISWELFQPSHVGGPEFDLSLQFSMI